MPTIRQIKINKLIQEVLSEVFRQQATDALKGILLTVSEVRVTPDLSIAKIYLSIFPSEIKEKVFKEIKELNPWYRKTLGDKVGKQIRKIPAIHFYLDETLDELEKIEKSLRGEGENPFK
jgi:ribosome-binding factor A